MYTKLHEYYVYTQFTPYFPFNFSLFTDYCRSNFPLKFALFLSYFRLIILMLACRFAPEKKDTTMAKPTIVL